MFDRLRKMLGGRQVPTALEAWAESLTPEYIGRLIDARTETCLSAAIGGMAVRHGVDLARVIRLNASLERYVRRTNQDLIAFEGAASVLGALQVVTRPRDVDEDWPDGSIEALKSSRVLRAAIGAGYFFEKYSGFENAHRRIAMRSGGTGLPSDYDPEERTRRLALTLVRAEGATWPTGGFTRKDLAILEHGLGPAMVAVARDFLASRCAAFVETAIPLLSLDCEE